MACYPQRSQLCSSILVSMRAQFSTARSNSSRNQTGFDLWEEVKGSSFFTTASQYRGKFFQSCPFSVCDILTNTTYLALIEGAALAKKLGKSGDNYASIAPQVLCFMQTYWISSGKYVDSNSKYHSIQDSSGIRCSHSFSQCQRWPYRKGRKQYPHLNPQLRPCS